MAFSKLGLAEPFLAKIQEKGFDNPTLVQEKTIPLTLQKKDTIVCAKTGSGKTLAFLLPILHLIYQEIKENTAPQIKALVLAPTRELVHQIFEEANYFLRDISISSIPIYGGVPMDKQKEALKKKCDILVATPGRLLDFLSSKDIFLGSVQYVVLDEADRMLDMGFIDDVKHILKQIKEIKAMSLWSATLDYNVFYSIWEFMKDPEEVLINPELIDKNNITQYILHLGSDEKLSYISEFCNQSTASSIIIFVNTKEMVEILTRFLLNRQISANGLSSMINQRKRISILEGYKKKKFKVLVATDLASRGIHVDDIDLVINYDMPKYPDSYVHRIGRTARTEKKGESLSICCEKDYASLEKLENYLKYKIPIKHPNADILKSMPVLQRKNKYIQNNKHSGKQAYTNKGRRELTSVSKYPSRIGSRKTASQRNRLYSQAKGAQTGRPYKEKERNYFSEGGLDYPTLSDYPAENGIIIRSNKGFKGKVRKIFKSLLN